MKVACAFAFCLAAYCSPASAVLWKCPANPQTFERDLDPVSALSRGCEQLTHDDTPPATPQPRSNWSSLGIDSATQCEFYWDSSTVSTKGKHRKAWFMQSCKDATKLDGIPFSTDHSKVFLMYFDCLEHTLALMQRTNYSGEYGMGSGGQSQTYSVAQGGFYEPIPNTFSDHWFRMICGKPAVK